MPVADKIFIVFDNYCSNFKYNYDKWIIILYWSVISLATTAAAII